MHPAEPQLGAASDVNSDSPANHQIPRWLYVVVGCAALNSVNLGFDIGINAAVGPELEADLELDHVRLEIFIGSLDLFAIFGALGASAISQRLGRRRAFAVAALTFEVGIIIMVSSINYLMLMIGRVALGLGIGFGLAADPMYISEISPAQHRGRLVTWSETGINVGIVIGFLAGYFFSRFPPAHAWRGMFLSGTVMPMIMLVLVKWVMPESPRWLVMKGRLKEAEEVLQTVSPADVDVSQIIVEIQDDIEQTIKDGEKVRWRDLICCPGKGIRVMVIAGVGTASCQQFCGIDAVLFFMLFVMKRAGIKSKDAQFQFLLVLGFIKLFLIPIAGKILDKAGRRPSILYSAAGMAVACFGLSFNFALGDKGIPQLALLMLVMYMASFSLGMGPGAWLVASEIFPTAMRSKGMSLATVCNRAVATLMASTVLSLAKALTWAGYFCVLALINLAVFAFERRYLPETKGKTLEELASHFAQLSGESESFVLTSFAAQEQQPQASQELPTIIGRNLETDANT